jgi:ADP-ribose pyrophosphatase YjhB (NUDIX family)
MRHTVRGLIFKNKKILLVTGHNADFYWTPGGGREPNETDEQTLKREIKEELGVEMIHFTYHSTYEYNDQHVTNYVIQTIGEILPAHEITGIHWYDSYSNIKPSDGFRDTLLPLLLKEERIG